MKNYGAMRFVAGVMQLMGWLTVLLGVLAFVLNLGGPSVPNLGLTGIGALLIGGGVVLTGIFTIAAGQMVVALADMATNSWHLREIAENAKRTVGFFEHIASPPAANIPTMQP
jgi:hypothetical protein